MKKITIITFIILTSSCAIFRSPNRPIIRASDLKKMDYMEITTGGDFDTPPMYPYGDKGVVADLRKELRYPKNRKRTFKNIRVVVLYEVTKTGKIGEVRIRSGADEVLNKEIIRTFKTLQLFYPAFKGGKPVAIFVPQPLNFTGI